MRWPDFANFKGRHYQKPTVKNNKSKNNLVIMR